MSNKIKKIVSGLMCMALLAVYTVPVNAAQFMGIGVETASTCNHTHHKPKTTGYEYTSAGSSLHHITVLADVFCLDCGAFIKEESYDQGFEDHSWRYRDLGHADGYHNYEVICRYCYHTEKANVYCPNKNGPHNTP